MAQPKPGPAKPTKPRKAGAAPTSATAPIGAKFLPPPAVAEPEQTYASDANIEQRVLRVARTLQGLVDLRDQAVLETVVDALVPMVPLPEHLLIEARMAAQARRAVLESAHWLTAAQIADLGGYSKSNPSAQPNRWKTEGSIFAIRHKGTDYFPAYALDPDNGYRPRAVMTELLGILAPHKDGWGLAYWFAGNNGMLGGACPQELMASKPQRVIAAARDEIVGVQDG